MSSSSAAKTRTALTLAAGAAAAVTTQQAGAAVYYTPLNAQVNAANPLVSIDFNHDGTSEVAIGYAATPAPPPLSPTTGLALTKQGSGSFPAYVAGAGTDVVKALSAGDTIDTSQTYNSLFSFSVPFPINGTINDAVGNGEFTAAAGEKYIGVEFGFGTSDGPYLGWIGFRADDDSSLENLSGTVTGLAYESDLGQPITAGAIPEPSSLGLLAMGATALAAYRRRGR